MDIVYIAMVLVSVMFYGLLPFFWISRHMIRMRYGAGLDLDLMLVAMFAMLALVIYALLSPYMYIRTELPSYAPLLGWALIALALGVEAWSLRLLGRALHAKKMTSVKIISSGPFSVVRHPIYLCHMAMNLGIYLATGSLLTVFVFVEWLLLIRMLANIEEEELALRLEEELLEYRKRVPQLIPKVM